MAGPGPCNRANNGNLLIHHHRYRNYNDARSRIEIDLDGHAVHGFDPGCLQAAGGIPHMADSSLSTGGFGDIARHGHQLDQVVYHCLSALWRGLKPGKL